LNADIDDFDLFIVAAGILLPTECLRGCILVLENGDSERKKKMEMHKNVNQI
jgi:hypothetical protein